MTFWTNSKNTTLNKENGNQEDRSAFRVESDAETNRKRLFLIGEWNLAKVQQQTEKDAHHYHYNTMTVCDYLLIITRRARLNTTLNSFGVRRGNGRSAVFHDCIFVHTDSDTQKFARRGLPFWRLHWQHTKKVCQNNCWFFFLMMAQMTRGLLHGHRVNKDHECDTSDDNSLKLTRLYFHFQQYAIADRWIQMRQKESN